MDVRKYLTTVAQQNIDKQYKYLKEKMNARNTLLTAVTLAVLSGCGGGGDGDTTSNAPQPTPAPPVSSPLPPVTPSPAVLNPLTGAAAPGSPTTTLVGFAYAGASVTAFSVNADGSTGAALAGPVVSTLDGFTLNFPTAPTSWVRLVSTGGTKERRTDNTVQPGGTMQLVTPFVTTSHNTLKISPMTDIAASVMASNVKKGMTLADAFSAGMRTMLQLDAANAIFLQDSSVYFNVLKGSIKSDTKYYDAQALDAHELLLGLENLGVMLDMPAKDVMRVVGASAQSNYLASGVDGVGAVINAGAWVGTTFDAGAPQSLKDLMTAKVPDGQKVTDSATGLKVGPRIGEYVSKYMIMDFIMDGACRRGSPGSFTTRYPFHPLDGRGNVSAAECAAAAARIAVLRARIETNKSTLYK